MHTVKVRPENADDNMPGHRSAGVHGVIVDNRLVDAAPMWKVCGPCVCASLVIRSAKWGQHKNETQHEIEMRGMENGKEMDKNTLLHAIRISISWWYTR